MKKVTESWTEFLNVLPLFLFGETSEKSVDDIDNIMLPEEYFSSNVTNLQYGTKQIINISLKNGKIFVISDIMYLYNITARKNFCLMIVI